MNGSPGRGSVGTDLNAIPAFAIEGLDVLRDGASAQYGSDAIAGVINLRMKKDTGKLNLAVNTGGFLSSGANDHRGGIDGFKTQLDANYGTKILGKGFVNFTGSFAWRDDTNRATDFNGSIFNAYNAVERVALANGTNINSLFSNINALSNSDLNNLLGIIKNNANQISYFTSAQQSAIQNANTLSAMQSALGINVTDNELAARGLTRRDFNMRVGQSKLLTTQFFVNSEIPINDNHKFYAFGGYSNRDGNSAGFYSRPNQSRTYTGIYSNGFLPEIGSTVVDYSAAGGFKGKIIGFNYDLSNTFGVNSFEYNIENTANVTMGMNSPTSFYAGKLKFQQNTTNLDFQRNFDLLDGLSLAFGGEFRLERYILKAGDEASYATYNTDGSIYNGLSTNNLLRPTDFFGAYRPGGAQVFPGFRPVNQVNGGRKSGAVYLDSELDVTKWLLLGVAGRYENYSDFGSTFNYKFATRIKANDDLTFRGALSTGFRAPSLAQIYFNSTSTQFIGGNPFEVGTFPNGGLVANALGIPTLKQEESNNYSLGATYKIPNTNLTVSADGYYIKIKDRVVLTDGFTATTPELAAEFEKANANTATFFTNAVDTQSRGLDVVITNKAKLDEVVWNTNFAATFSSTKRVGDIHGSQKLIDGGQINKYYSEATRIYMEEAVPRVKANLMNTITYKKWDFFMRQSYFGKVTDPNTADVNGDGYVSGAWINGLYVANEHPLWGAKTITDVSVSYAFSKKFKLTVGANNIFDIYPDKNLKTQQAFLPSSDGIYRYFKTGDTNTPTGILPGPGGALPLLGNNLPSDYVKGISTIDLSNNNQFEYSRNVGQFGMNGRYIFTRISLTF